MRYLRFRRGSKASRIVPIYERFYESILEKNGDPIEADGAESG